MSKGLKIGRRARAARTAQGLTQADVAAAIGISVEVYGRMEREHVLPSVTTLARMARTLRVTPNDLLGISEPEAATISPELRRVHRLLERIDPGLLPHLAAILRAMARPLTGKRKPDTPTKTSRRK